MPQMAMAAATTEHQPESQQQRFKMKKLLYRFSVRARGEKFYWENCEDMKIFCRVRFWLR